MNKYKIGMPMEMMAERPKTKSLDKIKKEIEIEDRANQKGNKFRKQNADNVNRA